MLREYALGEQVYIITGKINSQREIGRLVCCFLSRFMLLKTWELVNISAKSDNPFIGRDFIHADNVELLYNLRFNISHILWKIQGDRP